MIVYTASLSDKGSTAESFLTLNEALEWYTSQSYKKPPTPPFTVPYTPTRNNCAPVYDSKGVLVGWITVKKL